MNNRKTKGGLFKSWNKSLRKEIALQIQEKTPFKNTEFEFIETWIYNISNNQKSLVIPIYHPSAGFDWNYWHEVIIQMFKLNK